MSVRSRVRRLTLEIDGRGLMMGPEYVLLRGKTVVGSGSSQVEWSKKTADLARQLYKSASEDVDALLLGRQLDKNEDDNDEQEQIHGLGEP